MGMVWSPLAAYYPVWQYDVYFKILTSNAYDYKILSRHLYACTNSGVTCRLSNSSSTTRSLGRIWMISLISKSISKLMKPRCSPRIVSIPNPDMVFIMTLAVACDASKTEVVED